MGLSVNKKQKITQAVVKISVCVCVGGGGGGVSPPWPDKSLNV